jgi:site-specific recombinase XerD
MRLFHENPGLDLKELALPFLDARKRVARYPRLQPRVRLAAVLSKSSTTPSPSVSGAPVTTIFGSSGSQVCLIAQRRASPHTVASYRDTFRVLMAFAQQKTGKRPSELEIEDLDAELIGAFLKHLEVERHNSVRTRNNRLAAIHSLFVYGSFRHPDHAGLIQRVLAIPPKRVERRLVSFLHEGEVKALLAAPDRKTWVGRRDHALLAVALQTGLRVSELAALVCADVDLHQGAHLRCHGRAARSESRRSPR